METYTLNSDQKLENAQKRVKCIKGFYNHATVYLFVNLFLIISSYVENPHSIFTLEPYITAFFWGIGLAAHGFSVFGKNYFFGKDWEEREIQKLLKKD